MAELCFKSAPESQPLVSEITQLFLSASTSAFHLQQHNLRPGIEQVLSVERNEGG